MKGYNHSISSRIAAVIFFAAVFILFPAGAAFSQELTIPYVFSPGNVISSFEMNENFRVLAEKTNSLDSVINNLDASNSFWGYDSGTLTYSGGNVGIGTTSPVSPFTVAKNDGLATDGAHILSTIYRGLGDNSNAGVSFGYFVTGGIQSAGYIRAEDELSLMLGTIGTPQALTITDSGNVGIGTTSPIGKLHIQGFNGATLRIGGNDGSDNAVIELLEDSDGGDETGITLEYQGDSNNLVFKGYENGSHTGDLFTITRTGTAGIGTDSPEADLHIRDNNPAVRFEDPFENNNEKLLQFMNTGTLGGASYGYKFSWRNDDETGRADSMILDKSGQVWFMGGNVGIGTNEPGSYSLYVNGDAYCTGSWSGSDIRWKKDIKPIESSLEKIKRISGVSYRWKTDEFKDLNFDDDRHIGIIAQEMEKVFPELVNTNDDGYKAVAYDKLTAVLLEAVKEQQDQIEALQQRIKELKEAVLSE
jgi:hypothetical protein